MEFQSGAVRPVGSIQEGFDLIKDQYWTFFLMTLVAGLIIFVASLILGFVNNLIVFGIASVLGIAMQNSGDVGRVSATILPQILSMGIGIFTNIIVATLSGVLFCGFYKGLARKADSGIADFGDLFAGFEHLQACFIAAVVIALVGFAIGLVTLLFGAAIGVSTIGLSGLVTPDGKPNPAIFGSLIGLVFLIAIVSIVINMIFYALTTFIYPLIAERNLSGGEAVLLSFKSGLANLGGLILLIVLLCLMALGGLIACLIGVFFVAPILYAAIFSAFRSVFGKPQDSYQYSPPSPPTFGNQPGY